MPDPQRPPKPTREAIASAYGKTVPDLIAPGLKVLFVGINPSLYSAAVGHHFARPGNRFWPALRAGGFTPRLFAPWEGPALLSLGVGITNIVPHATATAAELTNDDYLDGARLLTAMLLESRPRFTAFVGITSYRIAFGQKHATVGPQPSRLAGSSVWVLPNPSGLNAHYQPVELGRLFGKLREAVETGARA